MDLTQLTALSALAVVAVEEILKLKVVPLQFANKYPVVVNVLLSILASIFVVKADWSFANWRGVLLNVATIAVVAAVTYNQLVGKSAELKSMEG